MNIQIINKNQVMNRVLKIAQNGICSVKINPLVGCIITDKNGFILGKGCHQKYGADHAEIDAIKDAIRQKHSLKDAILYINLEPCSHFGKTPPCVNAIIESGIKKVIIGQKDPNPLVNGKGIDTLRSHNIEVEVGVLEEKCKDLNKAFIVNKTKNRPFIMIKCAATIDGKIADSFGNSKWITSEKSRGYVHKMRYNSDAILTTAKTIMRDNPLLNVRIKNKEHKRTIIIVDRDLSILKNTELNIFKTAERIIFLHGLPENPSNDKNISFIKCNVDADKKLVIAKAMKSIYEDFLISSIMTECGGKMISYLIENNLFDEMNIFMAPKISISNQVGLFSFTGNKTIDNWCNLTLQSIKKFSSDVVIRYRND